MEWNISFKSINPADNTLIKKYSLHSFEEIEKIINQVQIDFHIWRNVELFARLKLIKNLALYFEDNIETLSNLITMEMGKPLQQSRQEIKKCIKLCKYYFDNSEKVLVDNPIII